MNGISGLGGAKEKAFFEIKKNFLLFFLFFIIHQIPRLGSIKIWNKMSSIAYDFWLTKLF